MSGIHGIKLTGILILFLFNIVLSQGDPPVDSDPNRDWDGVTHWSRYIVISPGYMGPNALPIPENIKGKVRSGIELTTRLDYHYFSQDKTTDLFIDLYIPIIDKLIAVEFYGVAVEYFTMDSALRYERKTFKLEGEGFAVGDINFATIVQLLKDRKNFPDLALRLNCKTASGTKFTAARYTDTPAYFFDISVGKNYQTNGEFVNRIDVYGTIGFYVWQTYSVEHRQNDALSFGLGFDINMGKFQFTNSFDGYSGYINNGDKPRVYRTGLKFREKKISYQFGWQKGFKNMLYDNLNFSIVFNFD
jgi:hypothetical protein